MDYLLDFVTKSSVGIMKTFLFRKATTFSAKAKRPASSPHNARRIVVREPWDENDARTGGRNTTAQSATPVPTAR